MAYICTPECSSIVRPFSRAFRMQDCTLTHRGQASWGAALPRGRLSRFLPQGYVRVHARPCPVLRSDGRLQCPAGLPLSQKHSLGTRGRRESQQLRRPMPRGCSIPWGFGFRTIRLSSGTPQTSAVDGRGPAVNTCRPCRVCRQSEW